MSKLTKDSTFERRIEDVEKDIVSVTSGETRRTYSLISRSFSAHISSHDHPAAAGIDSEVADFFASQSQGPIEIDEATDRRLRWMIHKRVLVRVLTSVDPRCLTPCQLVMVVTYFAQTLDKG